VIEMTDSAKKHRIGLVELTYFVIAALLLLLLGIVAKGQGSTNVVKGRALSQVQQPRYTEYRGVHLGMTAAEVRTKLGDPTLKSDEQDFFVISATETTQVAYTANRVVTISTDYTGGVGAPDYRSVVGEGLLQRPDGSVFRMVMFESERFWVTYNKTAATVPTVTITIGAWK
jgi:hypothetical protein